MNKLTGFSYRKTSKIRKKIFDAWQKEINEMLTNYMKQNNVDFTDLVKILNISPTQIAKIQKGQANVTITSMGHVFCYSWPKITSNI